LGKPVPRSARGLSRSGPGVALLVGGLVSIGFVLPVLAGPLLAQRGQGADALVPAGVPPASLPHNSRSFERMVEQTALLTHKRFGIEIDVTPHLSGKESVTVPLMVSTAGRRVGDVLDGLVSEYPEYRWRTAGDLIVVEPKDAREDVLDHAVPSFKTSNATLAESIIAVHRIFNPAHPALQMQSPASLCGPGDDCTQRLSDYSAAYVDRRSVELKDATVRQVLTAIGAAFNASWVVRHYTPVRTYSVTDFGFSTGTSFLMVRSQPR
jgi:hypothetical protein